MPVDIRQLLLAFDRRVYKTVFSGRLLTIPQMEKIAGKLMRRRPPGAYWFPEGFYGTKSEGRAVTYRQDVPRYSTDIKDAFLVVEHMRRDGFAFRLTQNCHDPVLDHRAVVSFVCGSGPCEKHGNKAHNHHGSYDLEAPTSEQAICLAALKAIISQ